LSWWSDIVGRRKRADPREEIRGKLRLFRHLLEQNNQVLGLMASAEEKLGGEYIFDRQYLITLAAELGRSVHDAVLDLNAITDGRYLGLTDAVERVRMAVQAVLESRVVAPHSDPVIALDQLEDHPLEVGGEKMRRLAFPHHAADAPSFRVPPGFVISAGACQRLLRQSSIDQEVETLFEANEPATPEQLEMRSKALQRMVLRSRVPRSIARPIRKGVGRLTAQGWPRLAIRSSALGEDAEQSFAGQYETVLGVTSDDVLQAYKQVVASLYSPQVMRYRQERGFHPARGLMAVGCMGLVPARASGVAYSIDPSYPEHDTILVSAAWGLGKTVVEGIDPTDRYHLSRAAPYHATSQTIGHKQRLFTVASPTGVHQTEVPLAERDRPCLSQEELGQIAATLMFLERRMRCAQDMEWAIDAGGQLYLLQSRPLRLSASLSRAERDMSAVADRYPVLSRGRGAVACRGIGAGTVCFVDDATQPRLSRDAVLVARTSGPRLSGAIAGAAAVLTEVGTPTGHLATIAREYRVPTIVDMGGLADTMRDGDAVTVDAEENVVYRGIVHELLRYQLLRTTSFEDTVEYRLLRGLLKRVAPLSLNDPASSRFTPAHCVTYHDIIRFAHEKAVSYFADGSSFQRAARGRHVRRLRLGIPLDLVLVDVGGGCAVVDDRNVTLEQVGSMALRAVLCGLTAPGVWATEPTDMDLNGFISSATRSQVRPGMQVEQNVAIVTDAYLNLSLHLGYHFNVVDCYLSEQRNDNYIYFRFAGGVTEMTRRSRRVALLAQVLEAQDFAVELAGDLICGRIKKIARETMIVRLEMIGRLIGFSRQLDILLRDDSLIEYHVRQFLAQIDDATRGPGGAPAGRLELRTTHRQEREMSAEILVLDDEQIVCDRLKEYLEQREMEVETFTDSRLALERLAERGFDVVVTDLKMNGPTGLDVLRHVRQHNPDTRVIVITGYATIETAKEAEIVGAFDFICKPFQLQEMYTLIKKAAKKARRSS